MPILNLWFDSNAIKSDSGVTINYNMTDKNYIIIPNLDIKTLYQTEILFFQNHQELKIYVL